jgi:hypothetical protein
MCAAPRASWLLKPKVLRRSSTRTSERLDFARGFGRPTVRPACPGTAKDGLPSDGVCGNERFGGFEVRGTAVGWSAQINRPYEHLRQEAADCLAFTATDSCAATNGASFLVDHVVIWADIDALFLIGPGRIGQPGREVVGDAQGPAQHRSRHVRRTTTSLPDPPAEDPGLPISSSAAQAGDSTSIGARIERTVPSDP